MRHSWGEPERRPHRTDRVCKRCGIIKITRHEPGVMPWQEFERDGLKMDTARTPPCEEEKAGG